MTLLFSLQTPDSLLHHLLDPSRLSAEHWPLEGILGTSSSLVGLIFLFGRSQKQR